MRRALFVVGMHRSGTSAIAAALPHAGFSHPAVLMPPQADNPDGFFEPLPMVRLNNLILSLAGSTWDRLPLLLDVQRLTPRPLAEVAAAQYGPAAADAWATAFAGLPGDVVAKDPRLCLTLPLWLGAARAAGFAPSVVLVARAPEAIALSLGRRNGFSLARGLDLVADYWAQMLANAPHDARILDADVFRDAPAEALADVGLGVSADAALARGPVRDADALVPAALVPAQLRALGKALKEAHGRTLADAALPDAAGLGAARATAKLYKGATYLVADEPPLPAAIRRQRGRNLIYHLHIFKNAGSSVDVVLKENFGARWQSREFPTRADHSNADVVNTFVRRSADVAALSSHTGDWWLGHTDDELTVFPIVFLREPFLRIASAYAFERTQVADTLGANLAKQHDFPGYVAARLERPGDIAFRNFQSRRLAALDSRLPTDLRASAFRALDRAPFVGLVEEFDSSLHRLEAALRPLFPAFRAFSVRANVSPREAGGSSDVAAAVARVRDELGPALAAELAAANAIDSALYAEARARFAPPPPLPADTEPADLSPARAEPADAAARAEPGDTPAKAAAAARAAPADAAPPRAAPAEEHAAPPNAAANRVATAAGVTP